MSEKHTSLNLDRSVRLSAPPTLRNITNTSSPVRSPQRPGSGSGFSPIRRSGSPMRRKQIQEIEEAYARTQSAKRAQEPPEESGVKRPKNVSFDSDVQVFDEPISSSYDQRLSLQQSVDSLAMDVSEIKSTQATLLKKLDHLITLLENKRD